MTPTLATEPRVFTIPASAPFLRTLIAALMGDRLGLGFKPGGDPLALAAATIYLPTRRSCRLDAVGWIGGLNAESPDGDYHENASFLVLGPESTLHQQ